MNPTPCSTTILQEPFAALRASRTALLTTFRRSGEGVGTPVGINLLDGKAYFTTWSTTGKVKRLRNNPHVTLAPCTSQGKVTGPIFSGVARLLKGAEVRQVEGLLGDGLRRRLWKLVYKYILRADALLYEVTPT